MRRKHELLRASRGWPMRRFVVVEDSMLPTLQPGDGLLALRGGRPRDGELRVFPDPRSSSRYLVKRVGAVRQSASGTVFEALSDNAGAPGATDSRGFGWVPAAESYRVVWKTREKTREVREVRADQTGEGQSRTISARTPSNTRAISPARRNAMSWLRS